jgi:hypothetical protein
MERSSNDVLIYDESDFRQGGRDVFRCGPPNASDFAERPRITSSSQTSVSFPVKHWIRTASVWRFSLSTLDLEATDEGAALRLTVQIVSLAGPSMIEEFESGNKSALENLSRHLSANP